MTKFSDVYPLLFCLTTTAFATVGATGASAATLSNPFDIPNSTPLEIAEQAYIWGYPLVALKRTEAGRLAAGAPPNQLVPRQNLSTPANRSVVRPNNDTLYASAFLDLSQRPLILSVPDTTGRYYSFQFSDAYTNTFNYVGTRENNTTAGSYAIVGPEWQGSLPSGLPAIESPTNSVYLLGRTLFDGTADLPAARAVQNQYKLSYYPSPPSDNFPSVPVTGSPQNIAASGLGFYTELNNLLVNNPPPASESSLLQQFATIGVGAGLTPTIDATTATTAIAAAESLIDQEWETSGTKVNNWSVNYNIGTYGTNYQLRAATAKYLLFALTADEALYFSTSVDVLGNPLTGAKQYAFSFPAGELPPLATEGFWSLTLYDSDGFLVDNSISRYLIGDRTAGLQYNPDGSLDIFIQNQPPVGKESNWLPAPAGSFNLTLRTYLPQEALLNGTYQVPPVVNRTAQAVPEPSSLAGIFGVLVGGAFWRRRNKPSS